MYKKVKIYIFSSLLLSLISTSSYSLAYFYEFDTNVGYLNSSSILVSISTIISILTIIWISSLFITINKNEVSSVTISYSLRTRIISFFTALAFIICFVLRFFQANIIFSNTTYICNFIGIFSSLYFLLIAFCTSESCINIKIISGIIPILFSALTITENHLNLFITMNSPIKTSLILAMMSIMLFMLYEIRSLANRQSRPKGFLANSIIASLLLPMFSIPYIAVYIINKDTVRRIFVLFSVGSKIGDEGSFTLIFRKIFFKLL